MPFEIRSAGLRLPKVRDTACAVLGEPVSEVFADLHTHYPTRTGPDGTRHPVITEDTAFILVRFKSVALCGEDLARAGKLVSAQALLPVYLRPPQAQRLRDRIQN